MLINFLRLAVGLMTVIAGAEFLVKGATALAKRFRISDMVIGMTIVAIGTSTPELVVSFIGAASGNADIAVGNVIGSNICNILLILGITALIYPLPLTKSNIRIDIPFVIISTLLLCILACDTLIGTGNLNSIGRTDGAILLFFFAAFMTYSFKTAKKGEIQQNVSPQERSEEQANSDKRQNVFVSILLIVLGLVSLVFGGDFMVDQAIIIAKAFGVSDIVIAATVVAIGTSLPELATSVVAACKKNVGLALGNVVGSNVINILLILGGSAIITPLGLANVSYINLLILCLSALFMMACAFLFKKRMIDRAEAVIFLVTYAAYIYFLIRA